MICGDVLLFNHWQPASNLPSERRHRYVHHCGRRDTIQGRQICQGGGVCRGIRKRTNEGGGGGGE
ncbi:hypothetical protein HanPI659440_Chr16g0645991 [Helianthus annuus]|uniref:Uncharacterized protein n=1 Tax=Helianthus annuus TaxID=4232 RepID=A0A251UTP1_HELAN|nr:hypothetical protein HanXRQr2_Chr05g0230971 [Helianthus annuus]KAJ0682317.1 hypothetical protein HanPI659440_Chr16g0645991 [Helianthus annuus]KAJ0923962.1 hypothetical protein HanPSC8_Chr05g0222751 [Helianthus annuus]